MEYDKEEYRCTLSLSTAFDPVKITPTTFLYDRNNAETLLEKNPSDATCPHTRKPFVAADITPNVALRAEMRQYFQDVKGTEYTEWEVIPDYPQQLSVSAINGLLAQIRQFFPKEEVELEKMSENSWSNAWKRLTYLRLNLQMNSFNRQLFLSEDSVLIRLLVDIIVLSYSRGVKTDESD